MERDPKSSDSMLQREHAREGPDVKPNQRAHPHRDLMRNRSAFFPARCGKARKIPQAGPALAWLTLSQQDAPSLANDNSDFRHVLVNGLLRRLRDLLDGFVAMCLAQINHRARLAPR